MKRKRNKPEQDWLGLILIITFGVVAVAFVSVIFYVAHQAALTREAQRVTVPPFYASAAAAQPLPATLEPNTFQEPRIQSAYAMARQKPAILAQQPCYCACDRQDTGACLTALGRSTRQSAPSAFAKRTMRVSWMRAGSAPWTYAIALLGLIGNLLKGQLNDGFPVFWIDAQPGRRQLGSRSQPSYGV